jgi:glutamine amidotransferase
MQILILDYGLGNISSLKNAFNYLGLDTIVSSEIDEINLADAIILPGVGNFGEATENIKAKGLDHSIRNNVVNKKKPILGICLGMQLLASGSEESPDSKGLSLIPGSVEKINIPKESLEKVPQIGWNNVLSENEAPLFENISQGSNFYFANSYHYVCNKELVTASTFYGTEMISAIQQDNIFGVQFHPEKSSYNGLKLLNNFKNYCLKYTGKINA